MGNPDDCWKSTSTKWIMFLLVEIVKLAELVGEVHLWYKQDTSFGSLSTNGDVRNLGLLWTVTNTLPKHQVSHQSGVNPRRVLQYLLYQSWIENTLICTPAGKPSIALKTCCCYIFTKIWATNYLCLCLVGHDCRLVTYLDFFFLAMMRYPHIGNTQWRRGGWLQTRKLIETHLNMVLMLIFPNVACQKPS